MIPFEIVLSSCLALILKSPNLIGVHMCFMTSLTDPWKHLPTTVPEPEPVVGPNVIQLT